MCDIVNIKYHVTPIDTIIFQLTLTLLTVTPELGFEPVWSWNHSPAFGAVKPAVSLSEGHGRKHVRHIVALIAQINLCARLKQNRSRGSVWMINCLKMNGIFLLS